MPRNDKQLLASSILCLFLLVGKAQQQQQHYFCNSSVPVSVSSQAQDVSLVTRPQKNAGFWSGLVCQFNIWLVSGNSSISRAYFIDIESFHAESAVLSITSADRVYFQSSSLRSHQSSLAVPPGELHIRFDATGDRSELVGARIRVRAFEDNGCPPGWTLLAGSCFGTSSSAPSLTFLDAQKACNGMRSNLLQLPLEYSDRVGVFARLLPSGLRRGFVWVGLTDRTSAGQFKHFWLNGDRQHQTSEIGCYWSGSRYSTCQATERCGTFYDGGRRAYAIYMDNCLDRNKFACSMPPGGTIVHYTVPGADSLNGGSSNRSAWVWGGIAVGMLLLSLAVVAVHSLLRSSRSRRAAAATTTAAGGRVATAAADNAPAGCRYPEPPPSPPPPPPPPPPHLLPHYPAAPPSYEAAIADTATDGGRCNGGFDK